MICIIHGYLLEGSGSNLWTRLIIRALCKIGENVHVMCQENHPERYDFISEAHMYHLNTNPEIIYSSKTPYPGKCILHKPVLAQTLPVYVWDKYEEFSHVVPMIDLDDTAIAEYFDRNCAALEHITTTYPVTAIHANHAVLSPTIAQRIAEKTGIPFAIMPHGSAIEYAVKKDPRFLRFAEESFTKANKLFYIGPELYGRIQEVFKNVPNIKEKMVELNLGVDTASFVPVKHHDRPEKINTLLTHIDSLEKGKTPEQSEKLVSNLSSFFSPAAIKKHIAACSEYSTQLPDRNITHKLSCIDWKNDSVLLYVGRIIAAKGVQSIIAALPEILSYKKNTHLVLVGHGPLREPLELLVHGLKTGDKDLVLKIVEWGSTLEGSNNTPLERLKVYIEQLEQGNRLDNYFEKAQRCLSNNVHFVGYLTHTELHQLIPCTDIVIFPSIVAEAGPLVFLEALSSGSFPLGTYFAGTAASIDAVSEYLPEEVTNAMKISPNPRNTVTDIIKNVIRAISFQENYKKLFHDISVKKYDWENVAQKLKYQLELMKGCSL